MKKNKDKTINIFDLSTDKLPLVYYHLRQPDVFKVTGKISTSSFHKSIFYSVGYISKPISDSYE